MTTDAKPGCLFSILRIFGLRTDAVADAPPESLPYRVRDDFLSPAELSFYHVLALW